MPTDPRDLCTIADVVERVPGYDVGQDTDVDATLQDFVTIESRDFLEATRREITPITPGPDITRVFDVDWIVAEERELMIGDAADTTAVVFKGQDGTVLQTLDSSGWVELPRIREDWEPVTSLYFPPLVNDPAFFAWLEDNRPAIFRGGAARTRAIATSCAAKAAVVARDERETGERALLNLGHTFGHALEGAVGYEGGRLIHGEGVAIGMVLALAFSAELGLAPRTDAERLAVHLAGAGLPTTIADIPGEIPGVDRLLDLMAQDKKVKAGKLTFILARGIGRAFVANDVPADAVRRFLLHTLDRPQ